MKINCRTHKHKSHFPRGIAVWTHLHSVCLYSVYKIVMWYMSYLFIMTLWYKLFPFSIFLYMEFHGFLISDLHALFWINLHRFHTCPKDIYVFLISRALSVKVSWSVWWLVDLASTAQTVFDWAQHFLFALTVKLGKSLGIFRGREGAPPVPWRN